METDFKPPTVSRIQDPVRVQGPGSGCRSGLGFGRGLVDRYTVFSTDLQSRQIRVATAYKRTEDVDRLGALVVPDGWMIGGDDCPVDNAGVVAVFAGADPETGADTGRANAGIGAGDGTGCDRTKRTRVA